MSRRQLYLPTNVETPKPRSRWPLAVLAFLATSAILLSWPSSSILVTTYVDFKSKAHCVQAEPRMPNGYNTSVILGEKERIIKWLQGAVRIKTEMYDEMGPVDVDPRWKPIETFHDYLEDSFPLIHKTLTRKSHNLSLTYEWPGSNPSLKPLFLAAHQDVVPVLPSTVSQWSHDPFSGDYDGTFIWGRGSSDTKSSLIAIMASIEHLLETTDFKPTRTIVLGFGSDEERGGQVGAPAIAEYIEKKYGRDSIALLIDEGSGMLDVWGQQFALPGVAEKGHSDLGITVSTLGGHSSVPPPHTGIGLMSLLIAELEKNPHPVVLHETSPVYSFMTCAASYASDMPKALKSTVVKSTKGDHKAWKDLPQQIIDTPLKAASTGPGQGSAMRAMMSTTQAADLISGGIKVNALPESVRAVVNHRVDITSDHTKLQAEIIHTLLPVIKTYNLTLIDFEGKTVYTGSPTSKVILDQAFGEYTDPAPLSPTDATDPDSAWTVMAGTARGMWASRSKVSQDGRMVELGPGEDLVMAPFMSTGNTDTRHYWNLTKNIYRFRYVPSEGSGGAHTINEHTTANDLVEFARWYQSIILTMDQAANVA